MVAAAVRLRTGRPTGVAYAFTFILLACTMSMLILFVFNNSSTTTSTTHNHDHSVYWLKNIILLKDHHHTHYLSSLFSHSFNFNTSQSISNEVSLKNNVTTTRKIHLDHDDRRRNIAAAAAAVAGNNVKVINNSGSPSSPLAVKSIDVISKEEKYSSADVVAVQPKAKRNLKRRWWKKLSHCNLFDGGWVKDNSYPLYQPGSCPYIDEPFDCHPNGRPDTGYLNYRWQPNRCDIPRLNGKKMLQLLRGKRLVYVGDSLNRNMWESMVCLLRNSVKDKSKVFEVSGKSEFRKEGAYSFVFQDYNCSVEFFRSPFLVQEWEVQQKNGSKKDTLRIDMVERSCDKYKDADVLVFNTGHWWTHEKTSAGEGYYQEGSHVHAKLDVVEAFHKAMTTWVNWIEGNIDPRKTHVFFRGYSVSHFSGGEWYSGGKCHTDTEPIKDDKDLSPKLYPPIMGSLEDVLKRMKTPVFYLNITRTSDFRKDAHPSVYRQANMTEQEKRSFLRHQDCSHWCLPGVPDTWNELLYAQLLAKHLQFKQRRQLRKPKSHKDSS